MTREQMRELARANVATWPPLKLTPEQRDRLYVLLAPLREALAQRRVEQGHAA